jgi:hypothetical protein
MASNSLVTRERVRKTERSQDPPICNQKLGVRAAGDGEMRIPGEVARESAMMSPSIPI